MSRPRGDVAVGETLLPFVVEAIGADRMRTVSALLHDPTPIHFDVEAVRAQGLGDRTVNQGPLSLGYAAELISRWTGDPWAIMRLRCRMLGNVFAGERLVCAGDVVAVDAAAGTCEIALWITIGDRVVGSGTATVRLD